MTLFARKLYDDGHVPAPHFLVACNKDSAWSVPPPQVVPSDNSKFAEGRLTAPETKAVIRFPAPVAGGGASAGNRSFRNALLDLVPPFEPLNVKQLVFNVVLSAVFGIGAVLLIGRL